MAPSTKQDQEQSMNNLLPYEQSLLIIDEAPLDKKFVEYFAQFDFQVTQTNKLPLCSDELKAFSAIIINWALLQIESTIPIFDR